MCRQVAGRLECRHWLNNPYGLPPIYIYWFQVVQVQHAKYLMCGAYVSCDEIISMAYRGGGWEGTFTCDYGLFRRPLRV